MLRSSLHSRQSCLFRCCLGGLPLDGSDYCGARIDVPCDPRWAGSNSFKSCPKVLGRPPQKQVQLQTSVSLLSKASTSGIAAEWPPEPGTAANNSFSSSPPKPIAREVTSHDWPPDEESGRAFQIPPSYGDAIAMASEWPPERFEMKYQPIRATKSWQPCDC